MAQGWNIAPTGDKIVFFDPPPAGVAIKVEQIPDGGWGGTDVWALGAWSPEFGFPSVGQFFGDRLWMAGTPTDPQMIHASCIGDYTNFGRSSPMVDSDAVSFAINARQANAILDLVPLDSLLVLTTGGEYRVTGGADDVVTPSTIGVRNQGNSGSSDIPAEIIGESAIFIQAEGQKPRDLRYVFEKDGFRGNDIGIWGEHLLQGYEVKGVRYWKSPYQVVWFIREDGVLVGCTYMPEQEVIGWHWHDTDGKYLDACALPGRKESDCYYLVERVVDGEVVQFIERQAPTRFDDEADLFYVDCGVTYDGRNRGATTLQLTSTSGWSEDDSIGVVASAPLFSGPGDVGDAVVLERDVTVVEAGVQRTERVSVRLQLDSYVSATEMVAHPIGDVPDALRNVATSRWTIRRDVISDLWHLEGKEVSVLQDGAVTGPYTVSGGRITLQDPGGVVHVGLPYRAEVETLELNEPGGDPMRDKQKLTYKASLLVLGTRGVWGGGMRDKLYPVKDRRFENYGQPPNLKTGVFDLDIPSFWGEDAGRIRIESRDPLPMEILSITVRAASSNGSAIGAKS